MIDLSVKYKKVKSSLEFYYKGYPIHNIHSVDIISLVYRKKKFKLRQMFNLFITNKIEIPQDKPLLYSIGNYNRKDYYELLEYVRGNIDSNLLDLSDSKVKIKISIPNIYKAFRWVFFKKVDLGLLFKISLMTTVTRTLNVIDALEASKISGVSKFCSFCSNLNDEAILDYFFQKRNVQTFTLQHGLWFIYDKPPIDLIVYENLISNNLLCWGEYTKDEFSSYGIEKSRLIVAGYPKNIKPLTIVNHNNRKKRILVLFSRVLFDKNNLELAAILIKLKQDAEIEFKLHPSLSSEKYIKLAKLHGFKIAPSGTIQELLKTGNYDCSISYNTTAYYDSYINNCISLRYKDKDADNAIDVLNDSFSNLEELKNKMKLIKESQISMKLWEDVEKKLNYILGYGVNNYDFH